MQYTGRSPYINQSNQLSEEDQLTASKYTRIGILLRTEQAKEDIQAYKKPAIKTAE